MLLRYLRLSCTNLCNLECIYCNSEVAKPQEAKYSYNFLKVKDIEDILSKFLELGVKKLRITGGEPLLHPHIIDILKKIKDIAGDLELCITTNGTLLPFFSKELLALGYRINISLDSLNKNTYKEITGRDKLEDLIKGIEDLRVKSRKTKIKLNIVLIKGLNDKEIEDFICFAKEYDLIIRFIELLPIVAKIKKRVVPNESVINSLFSYKKGRKEGLANYYYIKGVKIGFINREEINCNRCRRVRITSDAKLKLCLFSPKEEELDIKKNNKEKILSFLMENWNKKGHYFNKLKKESRLEELSMVDIGG